MAACGQGILDRMGFAGTVTATFEDEAYQVTIEAREDDALIIGKGGETLDAIQHILLKAAGRREEGVQMKVDVSGYRHKREEDLASRVRAIAAEVLESGKSQLIGPLRAAERRTVHRAVASIEGVTTKALGEGLLKKILIHSEGVSDAADAEDATLEVTPLGPEFEMSRDVEPRGAGGRDGRRRSGERQGHRERRPESQHPRATPDVDSPTKRPPMVERPAEGGIAVDRIGSLAPKPLPETSVETTGPEPSEWGRRPRPAKGRRK